MKIQKVIEANKVRKVIASRFLTFCFLFFLILRMSLFTFNGLAQGVTINANGDVADNSAILDIQSDTTSSATSQGLLIPRMSTSKRPDNPAKGLIIYNTDCRTFEYYNGTSWTPIYNKNFLTAPDNITGLSTFVCGQTGVTYSVPSVSGATSYNWTVPSGSSVTSGQNTTNITVTYGNTSGSICVTASNSCFTSIATCFSVNNIIPYAAGTISGTNIVCKGQSNVFYSVPDITDATSYIWEYSGSGATFSGSTNPVTINFSSNATSGNITVKGANSCGNGTQSPDYPVTIKTIPLTEGTITGTNTVCKEQLNVSYSAPSITDADSYTWSYSGNGFAIISGTNNNHITSNFSNAATSGTLTFTPSNLCGTGQVSTGYNITVNNSTAPTTANAGSNNINIACGQNTATLEGNSPTVGTGSWSLVSGAATITTPSSPTSGVTGLALPDTAILRWTISNSNCTASTDDVELITTSCITCGTQVWATVNSNVGTRINHNIDQSNNGIIEKYCYNDLEANCSTYGALYQWNEAMQYGSSPNCDPCGSGGRQGICPTGFHIPTDLEWSRYEYCLESTIAPTGNTTLATFQNTIAYRGTSTSTKIKVTPSNTPAWNGTNTSSFSALPSGFRYPDGVFMYQGESAQLLSAQLGYTRGVSANPTLYRYFSASWNYAISVRCLKD
ncbi:MAG: hypothetical protein HGB12_00970 [Bacteroidetes bacterium]|nr:hypothetical protein [Bacteroidota bacterium]